MKTSNKPHVLITYIEAGMGHIVTARAISDSLREKYGDKIKITDRYILRDSENPRLRKYEEFMTRQVKMYSAIPGYCALQMASMHILGSKNTLKLIHSTLFYREMCATYEEYAKIKPDVIVCTHYFLLHAAIRYRDKFDAHCKVLLYCPDNMLHGWWDNRVDRVYTNCKRATKDAVRFGYPKDRIVEVFFPTRSSVLRPQGTKNSYREKFGIPSEGLAVAVADGVYAKGKARRVTRELLCSDIPLTVCVIAGKNEELLSELLALQKTAKANIRLIPLGFIENAPELYAACDIFITKAGPNAMLDSAMMGTPLIINYCASPIERASKRLFIDERRCGYYIPSPRKIREKIEEIYRRPEMLCEIKENLKFFKNHENGANIIADDIAGIIGVGSEEN